MNILFQFLIRLDEDFTKSSEVKKGRQALDKEEEIYSQCEIVEKSAEENTNEEPVVVVVSEISSNKGKINDESSTL